MPWSACATCRKRKVRCSHNGNAAQTPPKAKKATRKTCVMCRKKKLRCNRMDPCGFCQKNGFVCIQQTAAQGRPPISIQRDVWARFLELWDQRQVDVSRTTNLLKTWAGLSAGRGYDVSRGLYYRICSMIGIDHQQLIDEAVPNKDANVIVPVLDGFDTLDGIVRCRRVMTVSPLKGPRELM